MKTFTLLELRAELSNLADDTRAKILQRFFKTEKGEYGEGDTFLGITVPQLRKLSKKYKDLSMKELESLITSSLHEERLLSLFILILQFQKANTEIKRQIYQFYLKNISSINNWDLVDSSAEHIIGAYLYDTDKNLLYTMSKSKNIWERRISILSTFHYIKKNQFDDTLKISGILLNDNEDLIHKAVGWMLREIGKRNIEEEEAFLKKYYQRMPRTMLRYAIEKFDENKRKLYLLKRI